MPKIWLAQADKTMLQRAKSLLNKAAKESWPVVLTEQEVRLVLNAVASTVASAGDHSRHNLEEVSETDIQMLWLMGACRDETGAPQLGPDGRLACPWPWWGRSGQVAGVPIAAVGKQLQPNAAAANDRSTTAARMANRAVAKGRAAQEAIKSNLQAARKQYSDYRLDTNLKHIQNQNRIESDKNSIFDKMQAAAKQHEDLEKDLNNQQKYYEELEKSHKASQTLTPLQRAEQVAHPREFKERQDQRQRQLEKQKEYIEHTATLHRLARNQRIQSTQDYIRLVASKEAEKVRNAVSEDYKKTAKEFNDFAGIVESFIPVMEERAADKVSEAVQHNKDDKTAAENAGRMGAWDAYKISAQKYWKTKGAMNPQVAEDIGLPADKSLHHVIAPVGHHRAPSPAPSPAPRGRPFLPRERSSSADSTDSFVSTVSQ